MATAAAVFGIGMYLAVVKEDRRPAAPRVAAGDRKLAAPEKGAPDQNPPVATAPTPEPAPPGVEIMEVELTDFVTAAGLTRKRVQPVWRNVGSRPVREVFATIRDYDGDGRESTYAKDYCIYATLNERPGVAPGEVYRTREHDHGFILLTEPLFASRVSVTVTRVGEWIRE